jgi:hypothetical protein
MPRRKAATHTAMQKNMGAAFRRAPHIAEARSIAAVGLKVGPGVGSKAGPCAAQHRERSACA